MKEPKWKRIRGFAFFSLSMAAISSSRAVDRVSLHTCDGCTTAQEEAMVGELSNGSKVSVFYIGDARSLHKYLVSRSEQGIARARSAEPEPEYVDAHRQLMLFHDTKPYGFRKYYEFQLVDPLDPHSASFLAFHQGNRFVPRNTGIAGGPIYPFADYNDPSVTVYDAIRKGARQANLIQAVRDDMLRTVGIRIDDLVSACSVLVPADERKKPVVDVVLHFADGGQLTLVLDRDSLIYGIARDRTRDSHGNSVPIDRRHMKGTIWSFDFRGQGNPLDRRYMWDRLHALGVRFVDTPPQSTRYTCGHPQAAEPRWTALCKRQ